MKRPGVAVNRNLPSCRYSVQADVSNRYSVLDVILLSVFGIVCYFAFGIRYTVTGVTASVTYEYYATNQIFLLKLFSKESSKRTFIVKKYKRVIYFNVHP